MKSSLLFTAGLGAIVVAYLSFGALQKPVETARQPAATALVPLGVTLTTIGNPELKDGVTHLRAVGEFLSNGATVFSDSNGLTLYNYDKDHPGASSCAGECAQTWPPATPLPGAHAVGDWSIITRADGALQWAYKGKPLYRYSKDEKPGEAGGDRLADGAWHPATFKPASIITQLIGHTVFKPEMDRAHPADISLAEVEEAGGEILVDEEGRTLYFYSGDLHDDGPHCPASERCDQASPWLPVAAPDLAQDVGDFSIVTRPDGSRQWAYKGKAIYRYSGDAEATEVNGVGRDSRWTVALVVSYPTPAAVTLRSAGPAGTVFATPDGHTLYRQHIFYYGFGHDFQHGTPYYESIGRLLGTRACDESCVKMWHPFAAPADAQPAGHWTIVQRSDGTRQWSYKGYALYTYDGDKKPGDLLGRDTWDVSWTDPKLGMVSGLRKLKIDAETVSGIFWTTVYP